MTFSLPVFPLRQKSECLLSLEAYSQEQKKRICWCLAENITKQQHPASAPMENKVRDPCGSLKSLLGASRGSACGGGFAPVMLLPGELLWRLVFLPGEERVCIQAPLRLQLPALLGEAVLAFASADPSRGRLQ